MKKLYAGLALIAGAVTLGAQTSQYAITDLGSLGGVSPYGGPPTSAQSINNAGQVTGSSYTAGGVQHGFRTSPNSPINPVTDAIGTLGGAGSSGSSINNSGQVAGSAQLSNGDTHAIRVDADGSIHDLGVFGGTTIDFSLANGINDAGQVTGASWHAAPGGCFGLGGSVAFVTAPNAALTSSNDLGTLLSNCRGSDGYAVNSSGTVVGYSAFGNVLNPVQHAMVWTPTGGMVDLGVLGGAFTYPAVQGTNAVAYAINASGQIVGNSTYNHDSSVSIYAQHAFLTTASSSMMDLGTLGGTYSNAFGINSSGQIVGSATTTGDTAIHAYLYSGTMMDLNTMIGSASPWVVQSASAINDNGQIVATALFSDGSSHAVRMDPANLAVSILTNLLSNPSLALTSGQISSLTDKLNNALASIQAALDKQAVNQLGAFISSVQVQMKAGKMSSASGNTLIAAANSIITAVS